MELNFDRLMAAERSLDSILEVVRHMQYYVAPWQDTDLEREAALAVRAAIGSTDSSAYRRFLEIDPIFGSALKEAFGTEDETRLIELAKDFDLTHHSHFAQTLTVCLRSLEKVARQEQVFVA